MSYRKVSQGGEQLSHSGDMKLSTKYNDDINNRDHAHDVGDYSGGDNPRDVNNLPYQNPNDLSFTKVCDFNEDNNTQFQSNSSNFPPPTRSNPPNFPPPTRNYPPPTRNYPPPTRSNSPNYLPPERNSHNFPPPTRLNPYDKILPEIKKPPPPIMRGSPPPGFAGLPSDFSGSPPPGFANFPPSRASPPLIQNLPKLNPPVSFIKCGSCYNPNLKKCNCIPPNYMCDKCGWRYTTHTH